jgi:hypothetical protein
VIALAYAASKISVAYMMGRLSAQAASWVIVLNLAVASAATVGGGREDMKALREVLEQTRRTLEEGTSRDEPLPAELEGPADRLSRAYAKVGDIDAALELAGRLPSADRLRAVCRVALERSRAGDPEAGVLFRQAFIEAGDDPEALGRVAFYLMHAGRSDEARATLDRIDDPAQRGMAQISALSAQVQADDLHGAERTLRALDGPTARNAVEYGQVSTLAYRQAKAGDAAAAMRTLEWAMELIAPAQRPAQRPAPRDWMLSRIAEGQAARGDADAALRTAASITSERTKRRALLAAAVAQAREGDKQGALLTVEAAGADDAIELQQKLIALALAGECRESMREAARLEANGDRAAVYGEVWRAATGANDRAAADEAERKIRQNVDGVSASVVIAGLQREGGVRTWRARRWPTRAISLLHSAGTMPTSRIGGSRWSKRWRATPTARSRGPRASQGGDAEHGHCSASPKGWANCRGSGRSRTTGHREVTRRACDLNKGHRDSVDPRLRGCIRSYWPTAGAATAGAGR